MWAESGIYDESGLKMTAGVLAAAMTLSSSAAPAVIPMQMEASIQDFAGQRPYCPLLPDYSSSHSVEGVGMLSILPIFFDIAPDLRADMARLSPYQSVLMELKVAIQNYFPNAWQSINQKFDENGMFYRFYIGIHSNMSVDEAVEALDRLDDAYIVPNMERLEGIVVDVVF